MPLPGDLTTITITGTWLMADGTPCGGSLRIVPTSEIADPTGDATFPATPVTVALAAGAATVTVPCTDNPGLVPAGWQYQVTETITYPLPPPAKPATWTRAYQILVPSSLGPTANLSSLAS